MITGAVIKTEVVTAVVSSGIQGEIISECPGDSDEVMVGAAKKDGLICCWNWAAIEFLRESEGTQGLAYRFFKTLSHAASCEYKERFHQKVWLERKVASDDTGLGEATKNAALKAKMEEIEASEKMKVEMEKARKPCTVPRTTPCCGKR